MIHLYEAPRRVISTATGSRTVVARAGGEYKVSRFQNEKYSGDGWCNGNVLTDTELHT